jgi:hypothetical protein
LLFAACSVPNPSPLSKEEIKGLIDKYTSLSNFTFATMEVDYEAYKKGKIEKGKSLYEQTVNFYNWYYPKREYKEQSPTFYLQEALHDVTAENPAFPEYIKLYNNVNFEELAEKSNVRIVSIDNFPKIADSYLVKFKRGDFIKGHILFKKSKTDDLPTVIDFDSNRSLDTRAIFKIAPYEVSVSYFDYNNQYPNVKIDNLIFNPKNIWNYKKEHIEKIAKEFENGEYYYYYYD